MSSVLSHTHYLLISLIILVISTLAAYSIAKCIVKSDEPGTLVLYTIGGVLIGGILCAILYYVAQPQNSCSNVLSQPTRVNVDGSTETLITADVYLQRMKGMNDRF